MPKPNKVLASSVPKIGKGLRSWSDLLRNVTKLSIPELAEAIKIERASLNRPTVLRRLLQRYGMLHAAKAKKEVMQR